MMDLNRFSGRVAVVTGAAGGMGSAISEDLVKGGMIVVGVDIRIQPLKELEARLRDCKGKLHPIEGDVSKREDLERVFQYVEDHFGGVSVMINNAGKDNPARLADMPFEQINDLIKTNMVAVAAASSKSIQSMKKHNIMDGHIINVSSILGQPNGQTAAVLENFPLGLYSASKHAVTALSRALRAELRLLPGSDIRVTNLCPGLVRTGMSVAVQSITNNGSRCLMPTDIARTVRFVLSSPQGVEVPEISVVPTGEVC